MKRKYCKLLMLLIIIFLTFTIQKAGLDYELKDSWGQVAENFQDSFFKTTAAKYIGDNCLIYQSKIGGFPKNYYIPNPLSNKKIEESKMQ